MRALFRTTTVSAAIIQTLALTVTTATPAMAQPQSQPPNHEAPKAGAPGFEELALSLIHI